MNDGLRLDLCCRFRAPVIACAAILAAARDLQIRLPRDPPWFELFGASLDEIDAVCARIEAYAASERVGKASPLAHVGARTRAWEPARKMSSKVPPRRAAPNSPPGAYEPERGRRGCCRRPCSCSKDRAPRMGTVGARLWKTRPPWRASWSGRLPAARANANMLLSGLHTGAGAGVAAGAGAGAGQSKPEQPAHEPKRGAEEPEPEPGRDNGGRQDQRGRTRDGSRFSR